MSKINVGSRTNSRTDFGGTYKKSATYLAPVSGAGDNTFASKSKDKEESMSKKYIVTNVSEKIFERPDVKNRIELANQKVFDQNRKVKFSELRRNDLNDLFKNTPAFDEPIPKY